MNNRAVSLLLLLCIVFPLLTIKAGDSERRSLLREEHRETAQALISSRLDQAMLESTPDAQMANLIRPLGRAAGRGRPLRPVYERLVAPLLPRHDLLVYDLKTVSEPVFKGGGLGEFPPVAKPFVQLVTASEIPAGDTTALSQRIRSVLRVALPAAIQPEWHGKWQRLRDRAKNRALFWNITDGS
ncbi:MAG TPA: hypothetical protein PLP29_18510 [Candidatus Ozemobacteraceae bacterium]|nr:hypothetical protein [Candidatus Ozemobacteraceae bacterium]